MRQNTKSPFIYLERKLIESEAFRKLTGSAKNVLLLFLCRKQVKRIRNREGRKDGYQITNNGEIVFTYDEAVKRGFSRQTFARALDQLVECGFIDISHPGGGMLKDCSRYAISERWRQFGAENFKRVSRKKDKRGLGFTAENWEERTGRTRKKKNTK